MIFPYLSGDVATSVQAADEAPVAEITLEALLAMDASMQMELDVVSEGQQFQKDVYTDYSNNQ